MTNKGKALLAAVAVVAMIGLGGCVVHKQKHVVQLGADPKPVKVEVIHVPATLAELDVRVTNLEQRNARIDARVKARKAAEQKALGLVH